MPRTVLGFMVGFLVSMGITIAICVKGNFVIQGPGLVVLWAVIGGCTRNLFQHSR